MKGTIKSGEEIERLFRSGRRSSSYLMTVLVAPAQDVEKQGRCAFIAGKKLGSAPLRSRCKRVLRASAAELGAPWRGFDVVFTARRKLFHASHGEVLAQMSRLLQKSGVMGS